MRLAPLLLPLLLAGCVSVQSRMSSDAHPVAPATPPTAPPAATPPTAAEGNPRRLYQLADLETVTIEVGRRKLKVWVMDTDSKRQEGMMFLTDKEVPDDHGMLFVFPKAEVKSFWMENTILPLDICYVGTSMKVLNIRVGKPYDQTGLRSAGPSRYVIEVKAGQAKKLGIVKGAKVLIPKGVRAKD